MMINKSVFKILLASSFLITTSSNAYENVVTLGPTFTEDKHSNNLQGVNLKYNRIPVDLYPWGGITSLSYSQNGERKLLTTSVGPSINFTDAITTYLTLGPALGSPLLAKASKKKYGISSSLGFSIAPFPTPVKFDFSYEFTSINSEIFNSYIIGVGYQF